MRQRLKQFLNLVKRPLGDERGIAAIEFGLMLPFLVFVFLGGYELSRYILISHKLEKTVYTISDVVAQQTAVTQAQLDQILLAASEIMQPYDVGDNGVVVLSSVYKETENSTPTVQWQYVGGGNLKARSSIGKVGNPAQLPQNLDLNGRDNIIIAEFFYEFKPVFAGNHLKGASLYKYAIFKPRLGALTTSPI